MNRSYLIALLVAGLLIVVALSHQFTGTTANDIAANKPKDHDHEADKGKDKPKAASTEHKGEKVPLPKPMGSPDAPVKIKVYVTSDNSCDTTTLEGVKKIAAKYGKDVYIEFGDLLEKGVQGEAQTAKISCKSGLTINGQSKFILPERGLKGAILLDGPVGQKNYKMKDIDAIVEHLLKRDSQKEDKG